MLRAALRTALLLLTFLFVAAPGGGIAGGGGYGGGHISSGGRYGAGPGGASGENIPAAIGVPVVSASVIGYFYVLWIGRRRYRPTQFRTARIAFLIRSCPDTVQAIERIALEADFSSAEQRLRFLREIYRLAASSGHVNGDVAYGEPSNYPVRLAAGARRTRKRAARAGGIDLRIVGHSARLRKAPNRSKGDAAGAEEVFVCLWVVEANPSIDAEEAPIRVLKRIGACQDADIAYCYLLYCPQAGEGLSSGQARWIYRRVTAAQ